MKNRVLPCTAASMLAGLALSTVPAAAFAQAERTPSHLDLFYTAQADADFDDFEFDDGDGYGAKGRFNLGPMLFFSGEYQNNEYDPFNQDSGGPLGGPTRTEVEIESWRAGLGVYLGSSPLYLTGEYIGFESELSTRGEEGDEETIGQDLDEDGYGVHVGFDTTLSDRLGLRAQIGYVDLGDAGDGIEYLAGASLMFTPNFGAFADYRRTELENDFDVTLQDVRVGLRFAFQQ